MYTGDEPHADKEYNRMNIRIFIQGDPKNGEKLTETNSYVLTHLDKNTVTTTKPQNGSIWYS